ncbi:MAG: signal peptidase I [Kiritimatiellae bacterium]|nr:signal peptidase I [Kiritimatiellia bacterium]
MNRTDRIWKAWGRDLALVLGIMIPFRSSIADWNHVPSGSMKPTILECERILVNKLAYDLKVPLTTRHLAEWGQPARGDIVVFNSPRDGTRLVKRVIGLPGDVIELRNNRLIINGESVPYERADERTGAFLSAAERAEGELARECLGGLDHTVMAIPGTPALRSFGPVAVPEGRYLVLGDNRDNSADSRYFGFVERRAIVGRASAVVVSFDPDRHYRPRFGRWFTTLR